MTVNVVGTTVIPQVSGGGSISGSVTLVNSSTVGRALAVVVNVGNSQINPTITALTFDGVDGLPLLRVSALDERALSYIYLYTNPDLPATGDSYTVSATSSDTTTTSLSMSVIELENVDTAGTFNTNTAINFGLSTSLAAAGSFLITAISGFSLNIGGGISVTADTGQTVVDSSGSTGTGNDGYAAVGYQTTSPAGWTVGSNLADSSHAVLSIPAIAASGPVITGPGTAQEGVATSIIVSEAATVTETTLQDSTGTYSVVQSTALNGGNLDVTPRRSVIAPTPGNPQPGIPVTPDITSPSVTTPWANRWRVTDE